MAPSTPLAVLTSPPLLLRITQFQRGIPLPILELVKLFAPRDNWIRIHDSMNGIGFYWSSVMRCGDLASVQLLCRIRQWPELSSNKCMAMVDLPAFAATCGRLDVILWLHENEDVAPSPWSGILLYHAIKHDEVARWLMANRPDACVDNVPGCLVAAASVGNIALLRDVIAFRPDAVTTDLMDEALAKRQWEVIRFLHEESTVGCSTRGMDAGADAGYLDVVQFLHENRTEGCTTNAMDYAASRGDLAMVKYLHENRTEGCTTNAMDDAAMNGHLDVVQFLSEHRTEGCTTHAMNKAAGHGRLDIVQYLHENRTEGCTERALMSAARLEHVGVVRFLHEKRGMKAPQALVEILLKDGNMKIVQYLHECTNVEFTSESVEHAKISENEELVQYVESRHTTQTTGDSSS